MIDKEKLNQIFRKSQTEFILSLKSKFDDAMISYFYLCLNKDELNEKNLKVFFHSLKGTAATFKFTKLSNIGDKLEQFINTETNKNYKYYATLAKGIATASSEYKYLYSSFIGDFNDDSILDEKKSFSSILIVDDDISIINYIKLSLEAYGYKVFTASSEKDALNILKLNQIEIVLLDLVLNNTNGYDVFKNIQNSGFNVQVIFLSSFDLKSTNYDISSKNYIKKPIDINEMISKIEALPKDNIIKLPENTEDVELVSTSSKDENVTSKKRILFIEDEVIMHHLIRGSLDSHFDFIFATNGEEGLDLYFKHLPDIVITDLMLPKVDGFEVCKKIRQYAKSNKTKLIVLSAKNTEDSIINSFELGIDDYITKPFNVNELLIRIKRLF